MRHRIAMLLNDKDVLLMIAGTLLVVVSGIGLLERFL